MPLPMPIIQIDPVTGNLTVNPEAKDFFKDLLQAQYLSRFINFPIGPRPSPFGDLNPQPNGLEDLFQESLLGELLIDRLGDSNSPSNRFSVITAIKNDKLDVEVVNDLMGQLETGLTYLKKELKVID